MHLMHSVATECIKATLSTQRRLDSFTTYLEQHGRHVTDIMVAGRSYAPISRPILEHLPCPNLQQVGLTNLDLCLGPDQDHPAVFGSSPALTRLELQDVGITEGSFAALAGLPKLEHLCFDNSRLYTSFNLDTVSAFVWATLKHLTHLHLSGIPVPAECLRDLSSMTYLRVLRVDHRDCRMLVITAPGVALPPSVQYFSFYGALGPSVLAAATQMTYLNLGEGVIEDEGGVSGGACLLEVLAQLQHLDVLSLAEAQTRWPAPSSAYHALVASSSKLRLLDVSDCGLPAAASAFMFPSASPHDSLLPSLQVLMTSDMPGDTVADMVKCCPALRQLWINVDGGAHLAALSRLSALTLLELKLHPEDDSGGYAVSIQCLAGLTQLHSLGLEVPNVPGTEHESLLPLTALQQLATLSSNILEPRSLVNKAGPGQPPDVWLQLLEQCAADSTCQRSIMLDHAQQLAKQQRVVEDLQQQNAALQQHVAGLQQQNASLQQQVTGLQQGQAQQQQHCAQLQEQVSRQGGQLQELLQRL